MCVEVSEGGLKLEKLKEIETGDIVYIIKYIQFYSFFLIFPIYLQQFLDT